MINKFVTVYAGHIDFPDHGQNTTPANERRFDNAALAGVYDKLEAIAKQMDRSATTRCGSPSTISSTRATRSCPTS